MSDTQSQLAEVDALIAASPEEPSLLQLREDLLQLIALEEQELQHHDPQPMGELHSLDHQHVDDSNEQQSSENYTAQSTFTDNVGTTNSLAEAPDLGSFQPVAKSSHKSASSAI
eukprot:scaffold37217_cov66-Skeletonema_marinoi.AAC.1